MCFHHDRRATTVIALARLRNIVISRQRGFTLNCRTIPLPSVNDPNNVPSPYSDPYTVAPEYDNGTCVTENQFEFHTEWSDGNVHSSGFTSAWPPNKQIRGLSMYLGMDVDLNGLNEELGGPSFAAINSRSYHPGGVNFGSPCHSCRLSVRAR